MLVLARRRSSPGRAAGRRPRTCCSGRSRVAIVSSSTALSRFSAASCLRPSVVVGRLAWTRAFSSAIWYSMLSGSFSTAWVRRATARSQFPFFASPLPLRKALLAAQPPQATASATTSAAPVLHEAASVPLERDPPHVVGAHVLDVHGLEADLHDLQAVRHDVARLPVRTSLRSVISTATFSPFLSATVPMYLTFRAGTGGGVGDGSGPVGQRSARAPRPAAGSAEPRPAWAERRSRRRRCCPPARARRSRRGARGRCAAVGLAACPPRVPSASCARDGRGRWAQPAPGRPAQPQGRDGQTTTAPAVLRSSPFVVRRPVRRRTLEDAVDVVDRRAARSGRRDRARRGPPQSAARDRVLRDLAQVAVGHQRVERRRVLPLVGVVLVDARRGTGTGPPSAPPPSPG